MENKYSETDELEASAVTIDLPKQKSKQREKPQPILSQYPPLPPTETSNAILHFVSSTSRFLNEFVAVANDRLENNLRQVDDVETQLMLLEAKLASDPRIQEGNVNGEIK